jgi:hypothetical protein
MLRRAAHKIHSFLGREQRLFLDVDADADDQAIDQAAGPVDHIDVAESNGVERAGVNGGAGIVFGHDRPFQFDLFMREMVALYSNVSDFWNLTAIQA